MDIVTAADLLAALPTELPVIFVGRRARKPKKQVCGSTEKGATQRPKIDILGAEVVANAGDGACGWHTMADYCQTTTSSLRRLLLCRALSCDAISVREAAHLMDMRSCKAAWLSLQDKVLITSLLPDYFKAGYFMSTGSIHGWVKVCAGSGIGVRGGVRPASCSEIVAALPFCPFLERFELSHFERLCVKGAEAFAAGIASSLSCGRVSALQLRLPEGQIQGRTKRGSICPVVGGASVRSRERLVPSPCTRCVARSLLIVFGLSYKALYASTASASLFA